MCYSIFNFITLSNCFKSSTKKFEIRALGSTLIYIKLAEKMRSVQLKKVGWNSYRESPVEETPVNTKGKSKTAGTKTGKGDSPQMQPEVLEDNRHLQIAEYIRDKVFPELNLPTEGKLRFCLGEDSIKRYVSLLPFSPEDYTKYQKDPIEILGFIQDAGFLGQIGKIQGIFNNHAWVKGACLRLHIMFMPILDEVQSFYI